MNSDSARNREANVQIQDDLRAQTSALLLERLDAVTADTVAIFPYSGTETLAAEYCQRVGRLLTELLAIAVRDGRLEAEDRVAELHRLVAERSLAVDRLFTFAYLTERAALDELALSDTLGATSEGWPLVAQLVRRAAFDLLAAYTDRAVREPINASIVDKLTTLYTRPLFDAVLGKEVEGAGRFGYPISVILFDLDRLSAINEEHGYGVGDRILERLGILIRQYFRQNDWVARHSEDAIAVLLSRTDAEHASSLAERVRATVAERLGFIDHRSERAVAVTLSAAVINVQIAVGDIIDPERLIADAEAAVDRAKQQGRNRVERVDGYSGVLRAGTPNPSP
jgi:diguanylate cyclase (GGDEF)-like protein